MLVYYVTRLSLAIIVRSDTLFSCFASKLFIMDFLIMLFMVQCYNKKTNAMSKCKKYKITIQKYWLRRGSTLVLNQNIKKTKLSILLEMKLQAECYYGDDEHTWLDAVVSDYLFCYLYLSSLRHSTVKSIISES